MNSQKAGNTLNLALDATFREREASMNLNVGYEKETQRWNLIIRYFGEASELETDGIFITPLLGNYGIADIPQNRIERFAQNPAVEYIEAPKRLYFAAYEGRQVSCVNPVQNQSPYLFGIGCGLYAPGFSEYGWNHTNPAVVGSDDPGQSAQRISDWQ